MFLRYLLSLEFFWMSNLCNTLHYWWNFCGAQFFFQNATFVLSIKNVWIGRRTNQFILTAQAKFCGEWKIKFKFAEWEIETRWISVEINSVITLKNEEGTWLPNSCNARMSVTQARKSVLAINYTAWHANCCKLNFNDDNETLWKLLPRSQTSVFILESWWQEVSWLASKRISNIEAN